MQYVRLEMKYENSMSMDSMDTAKLKFYAQILTLLEIVSIVLNVIDASHVLQQ